MLNKLESLLIADTQIVSSRPYAPTPTQHALVSPSDTFSVHNSRLECHNLKTPLQPTTQNNRHLSSSIPEGISLKPSTLLTVHLRPTKRTTWACSCGDKWLTKTPVFSLSSLHFRSSKEDMAWQSVLCCLQCFC